MNMLKLVGKKSDFALIDSYIERFDGNYEFMNMFNSGVLSLMFHAENERYLLTITFSNRNNEISLNLCDREYGIRGSVDVKDSYSIYRADVFSKYMLKYREKYIGY